MTAVWRRSMEGQQVSRGGAEVRARTETEVIARENEPLFPTTCVLQERWPSETEQEDFDAAGTTAL